jgi:hypothetical protein
MRPKSQHLKLHHHTLFMTSLELDDDISLRRCGWYVISSYSCALIGGSRYPCPDTTRILGPVARKIDITHLTGDHTTHSKLDPWLPCDDIVPPGGEIALGLI